MKRAAHYWISESTLLIDANIFKGFYQVGIGKTHDLCGCPKSLFSRASKEVPIYFDSKGIIEHEWRNVVDGEWYDVWVSTNYQSDIIQHKKAIQNQEVESKVRSKGFPVGRDKIYIRVALSVAEEHSTCEFFTEDLDFYDPTKKQGKASTRISILKNSTGPVAKILKKKGVFVQCVP